MVTAWWFVDSSMWRGSGMQYWIVTPSAVAASAMALSHVLDASMLERVTFMPRHTVMSQSCS